MASFSWPQYIPSPFLPQLHSLPRPPEVRPSRPPDEPPLKFQKIHLGRVSSAFAGVSDRPRDPDSWPGYARRVEINRQRHYSDPSNVPTGIYPEIDPALWPSLVRLAPFQAALRTAINAYRALEPLPPVLPPLRHIHPKVQRRFHRQLRRGLVKVESAEFSRDCEMVRRRRREMLRDLWVHRQRMLETSLRQQKICRKLVHQVSKVVASRGKRENTSEVAMQRARLSALKARDEESYLVLLQQTKNVRLLSLVSQTEAYMRALGVLVKQHREAHGSKLAEEADDDDEEEDTTLSLLRAKEKYFKLTHQIQEIVLVQPQCLMGGTLREYQMKGLNWLVSLYNNSLNGILADAMGLGKTVQTVALLGYLWEVKRVAGPHLIVAPLSTLHSGWKSEFERWLPNLNVVVYEGGREARRRLREKWFTPQPKFNVLLTTDAFILRDRSILRKFNWDYMIVDEAHRLKNPKSKLVSMLNRGGFSSRRRLALTGTPLQNDLQELWALLNFLMPTVFPSAESFNVWFNAPLAGAGSGSLDLTEEEQLLVVDRLHKVLRPFLLRREKREVEDEVPKKHEEIVWCPLSGLQRRLLRELETPENSTEGDELASEWNVVGTGNNAAMQMRKTCNHPYLFCVDQYDIPPDESIFRICGKFFILEQVLPKLQAAGHRVLIFSQMVKLLNILEIYLRLRNMSFLRLDGQTSSEDRQIRLAQFNAPGSDIFAFILSTKAGGVGVNLQAADTVVLFDSDWNPQNDEQAQSRAHRIGQTRQVLTLRLVTPDTIEERILVTAGVKLDTDALVIRSGMFHAAGPMADEDLEESRRQKVLEILKGKKRWGDVVKLFDEGNCPEGHGLLNRLISRSSRDWQIFTHMDKKRQLMRIPGLLYSESLPPPLLAVLARNRQKGPQMRSDVPGDELAVWRNAYHGSDTIRVDAQQINLFNLAIINLCNEAMSQVRWSAFITLPSAEMAPNYFTSITRPICLEHIRTFAERREFTSIHKVEKYLTRLAANCRHYNGCDHPLSHVSLELSGWFLRELRKRSVVEIWDGTDGELREALTSDMEELLLTHEDEDESEVAGTPPSTLSV